MDSVKVSNTAIPDLSVKLDLAQEEEEDWPEKYVHKDQSIRNKEFNKISKNFEKQLKIAFGNSSKAPTVPINLHQIYYASNPALVHSTLSINAAGRLNLRGRRGPTAIPGSASNEISSNDGEANNNPCSGVYIEPLSNTQEVRNLAAPYESYWSHCFALTLRPITKQLNLTFEGVQKFQNELDQLITEHFNEIQVTKLHVRDYPIVGNLSANSTSRTTNNLKISSKRLYQLPGEKSAEPEPEPKHAPIPSLQHINLPYNNNHKILFDDEDHAVLLIPNFTKHGFDSFDPQQSFDFPFQVEFQINQRTLQHNFNLPLQFKSEPQRIRLQFVFDLLDEEELSTIAAKKSCSYLPEPKLIIFSHFMVYSIMPTFPLPTISASLNVLESHNHHYTSSNSNSSVDSWTLNPEIANTESERLVKTVLNNSANNRYLNTGKRIRYNSVPVETLEHNGYMIGFNYIYSVKPKPNIYGKNEREKSRNSQKKKRAIKDMIIEGLDY